VAAALVVEVGVDFPGEVPGDFRAAAVFVPAVSLDQAVPGVDHRLVRVHHLRDPLAEQDRLARIRVHPEGGRTVIHAITPIAAIIDTVIIVRGIGVGTGGMGITTGRGTIRQRIGYPELLY